MVDGEARRIARRRDDDLAEPPAIVRGDVRPPAISRVERAQLHAQQSRLQLVEAAVRAEEGVLVLLHLPVSAEEPDMLGERAVVGGDHPRVAVRGEVLHDPQAEGAGGAEGAHVPYAQIGRGFGFERAHLLAAEELHPAKYTLARREQLGTVRAVLPP